MTTDKYVVLRCKPLIKVGSQKSKELIETEQRKVVVVSNSIVFDHEKFQI